jgi:hypothetical protein
MANNHNVVPVRRNIHDDEISFAAGTFEDGVICSRCGAMYHDHHWALPANAGRATAGKANEAALRAAANGSHRVLCPACRKAHERNPGGIVTLSGEYWGAHRDEILNLIRNEEKKAMGTNPVERILQIEERDGHLIVQTTNEKLAQRLGRAIHRACHGDVEYKWSEDTKLVRVDWHR